MPNIKKETSNNKSNNELSRCGFIALIGAPNAGKSTLLNSLAKTKISIVTHKAQTTRSQIKAIVNYNKSQSIFIDTPGIFAPKRRLDRAMIYSAWSGANEADIIALIIDAQRGLNDELISLLKNLTKIKNKKVLVLNKIDLIRVEKLLRLSKEINDRVEFAQTFMISALKGEGVEDFLHYCVNNIPFGVWLFPKEYISDLTDALTAAEIVREKLFIHIHDEIPYNTTVETESFKEQKDGSIRINLVIYVMRDSHKKIILGKGGKNIKIIGEKARKELSKIFATRVHLFLFIKVRKNWADDPERYREMGLELPKK